ncbi:MAG: leucine-rich repeat domain-containing protein, partial [Bacteroidales bacterium]|nr:leucine-rich repeat domain-containing protein [Bacteroidales bacterium]
CSSLTSINIPDGITTIDEGTFWECSSLTSINIPEGVTTIKEYAFSDCNDLKSITLKSANPPILDEEENTINRLVQIYVPQTAVEAYKSSNGWEYYADQIVGY